MSYPYSGEQEFPTNSANRIGRCIECGEEILRGDQHLYTDGDMLCWTCARIYSTQAEMMMFNSFKALPPLYRLAFSETQFSGLGDFSDEVEEWKE